LIHIYGQFLLLLIIDVDYFKRLNGSYGHLEGDRILRRIGGLIGEIIRKTDSAVLLLSREVPCHPAVREATLLQKEYGLEKSE